MVFPSEERVDPFKDKDKMLSIPIMKVTFDEKLTHKPILISGVLLSNFC